MLPRKTPEWLLPIRQTNGPTRAITNNFCKTILFIKSSFKQKHLQFLHMLPISEQEWQIQTAKSSCLPARAVARFVSTDHSRGCKPTFGRAGEGRAGRWEKAALSRVSVKSVAAAAISAIIENARHRNDDSRDPSRGTDDRTTDRPFFFPVNFVLFEVP